MITEHLSFTGKVAIVTGGATGIGYATALQLAKLGARVVICSRTAVELEVAATQIAMESGSQCLAVPTDVKNEEACIALVQRTFDEFGRIDILINNAGGTRMGPLESIPTKGWDSIFDLNVKSAFFVAQACARSLIRDGKPGSLIHMSSQMGHVGGPSRSLYCASKWALEGMSKAFALDLAGHRIRSNTIAPTFIETPLTKPYFENPTFKASVLAMIKLGRIGRVEDLMGAVLYLASDASTMMTGTSMIVDGGWTAE